MLWLEVLQYVFYLSCEIIPNVFAKTTRTLRIFLSHTVSGQVWQTGLVGGDVPNINFDTGEGIPAWAFKIEGRLLEVRPLDHNNSNSDESLDTPSAVQGQIDSQKIF